MVVRPNQTVRLSNPGQSVTSEPRAPRATTQQLHLLTAAGHFWCLCCGVSLDGVVVSTPHTQRMLARFVVHYWGIIIVTVLTGVRLTRTDHCVRVRTVWYCAIEIFPTLHPITCIMRCSRVRYSAEFWASQIALTPREPCGACIRSCPFSNLDLHVSTFAYTEITAACQHWSQFMFCRYILTISHRIIRMQISNLDRICRVRPLRPHRYDQGSVNNLVVPTAHGQLVDCNSTLRFRYAQWSFDLNSHDCYERSNLKR